MRKNVEKAYSEARDEIEKIAERHKIKDADWFEYLEELQAQISCMIDCYKEEHPEDFQ